MSVFKVRDHLHADVQVDITIKLLDQIPPTDKNRFFFVRLKSHGPGTCVKSVSSPTFLLPAGKTILTLDFQTRISAVLDVPKGTDDISPAILRISLRQAFHPRIQKAFARFGYVHINIPTFFNDNHAFGPVVRRQLVEQCVCNCVLQYDMHLQFYSPFEKAGLEKVLGLISINQSSEYGEHRSTMYTPRSQNCSDIENNRHVSGVFLEAMSLMLENDQHMERNNAKQRSHSSISINKLNNPDISDPHRKSIIELADSIIVNEPMRRRSTDISDNQTHNNLYDS